MFGVFLLACWSLVGATLPGFFIGESAPQTDSTGRIRLGRRFFPLETVWWGAETSAGIGGHLLKFIGPQKLRFRIFVIFFYCIYVVLSCLTLFLGEFFFLRTAESKPQILGFGRRF